jgi:hypothetical protein
MSKTQRTLRHEGRGVRQESPYLLCVVEVLQGGVNLGSGALKHLVGQGQTILELKEATVAVGARRQAIGRRTLRPLSRCYLVCGPLRLG